MPELFHNKYSKKLSPQEHTVLAMFYLHPTSTLEAVSKLGGTSYTTLSKAINKIKNRKGTAYYLFFELGYLEVPSLDAIENPPEHPVQQTILKTWRTDPFIGAQRLAFNTNYSVISIHFLTSLIYKHFGYANSSQHMLGIRLEFFEFMGWFDTARLRNDCLTYLRKEGYDELIQRALD